MKHETSYQRKRDKDSCFPPPPPPPPPAHFAARRFAILEHHYDGVHWDFLASKDPGAPDMGD